MGTRAAGARQRGRVAVIGACSVVALLAAGMDVAMAQEARHPDPTRHADPVDPTALPPLPSTTADPVQPGDLVVDAADDTDPPGRVVYRYDDTRSANGGPRFTAFMTCTGWRHIFIEGGHFGGRDRPMVGHFIHETLRSNRTVRTRQADGRWRYRLSFVNIVHNRVRHNFTVRVIVNPRNGFIVTAFIEGNADRLRW